MVDKNNFDQKIIPNSASFEGTICLNGTCDGHMEKFKKTFKCSGCGIEASNFIELGKATLSLFEKRSQTCAS